MRRIFEKIADAGRWLAWRLWGRRLAMRQVRKMISAGPPAKRDNGEIYRTIQYDDMNLDHYQKIAESAPKVVVPPPRGDDTDFN